MQPSNGYKISWFFDNPDDTELIELIPFMKFISSV